VTKAGERPIEGRACIEREKCEESTCDGTIGNIAQGGKERACIGTLERDKVEGKVKRFQKRHRRHVHNREVSFGKNLIIGPTAEMGGNSDKARDAEGAAAMRIWKSSEEKKSVHES